MKYRNDGSTLLNQCGTPLGIIMASPKGQVIGGVGVSGAASAAQDEQIATAGADAAKYFGGDPEKVTNLPVSYFSKGQTEAAFEMNSVLLLGEKEGRNYQVNASRRDGPGAVEVHTKDTDIFYVLNGSATIVTGGKMIDCKPLTVDEIRGKEIIGGETHNLAPLELLGYHPEVA